MQGDGPTDVQGVHVDRVTEWMSGHTALTAPLSFDLIAGGHSNLTFRVSDADDRTWVLRRPPLFQVLQSAHDMGREHRVIAALADSDVPVPGIVGFCDDESVNDRPFYVMEFVPGTVFRSAEEAAAFGTERLPHVTRSLIETLAAIHAVDVDAVGLGDLGRKENYIARQLRRWLGQFEASKTRERPELVAVHDHLVDRIPDQGQHTGNAAGLVHGDYRLDNCLVAQDGSIAAVLDWELCTLGDVLADVASLLTYWARPSDGFTPIDAAPTMADGFPEREQLLAWYQEASGRNMDDIDFYLSFASWRLASILEGVYSRYVSGAMGDAEPEGGAEAFVERIDALVAKAAEHAAKVA